MNPGFVNQSVLQAAAAAGMSGKVSAAVRLDRAFDNAAGEGMLLRADGKFFLLERPTGCAEFRCYVAPEENYALLRMEKHAFQTDVTILAGRRIVRCVWSVSENTDAASLLDLMAANESAAPVADTGVLFGAGLLYAAGADADLPAEEEALVRRLIPASVLAEAAAFHRATPLLRFAAAVRKTFNHDQKIALLANQLEVTMADAAFRSSEQQFMTQMAALLGFPETEYRAIEKTILLKNQFQVLFSHVFPGPLRRS